MRPTGTTSGAGSAFLQELRVPVLIVVPDFVREMVAEDYGRAIASLVEATELARGFGVRLRPGVPERGRLLRQPGHHARPRTRSAVPKGWGSASISSTITRGRASSRISPTSPSRTWAGCRSATLSGTPRELAGDGDRILPGEGDFQIGPILEHLGRIGYTGLRLAGSAQPATPGRFPPIGWPTRAIKPSLGCWARVAARKTQRGEGPERGLGGISTPVVVYREEQNFDWRVYAFIALAEGLLWFALCSYSERSESRGGGRA